MKYDPYPKYSFYIKTIFSILENLQIHVDYQNIKEIVYCKRVPISDADLNIYNIYRILIGSIMNRNITINEYVLMINSILGYKINLDKDCSLFIEYLDDVNNIDDLSISNCLILSYKNRNEKNISVLFYILSQLLILRIYDIFYIFSSSFFNDWENLLLENRSNELAVIIRTKICKRQDSFKILSSRFSIKDIMEMFNSNSSKLIALSVEKINLFGSFSNDTYTSQSDLDLIIFLKKKEPYATRIYIRNFISKMVSIELGRKCDLFFYDYDVNKINNSVVVWTNR